MNKIPVLYTTYNRLYYTKKSLSSLLENTPEGEIYIFDNGSDIDTVSYLKDMKTTNKNIHSLVLNDRNLGVTRVMNEFFEMTKEYEWIAKIDNDTLVPFGWLSQMINTAESYNFDILQAAHFFKLDKYKNWNHLLGDSFPIKTEQGNIIPFIIIGGSGIVVRRNCIERSVNNLGKIYGWSQFQEEHPEIKKAFYDGIWIDLLDMETFNKYKSDVDLDYLLKTGRIILATLNKDATKILEILEDNRFIE